MARVVAGAGGRGHPRAGAGAVGLGRAVRRQPRARMGSDGPSGVNRGCRCGGAGPSDGNGERGLARTAPSDGNGERGLARTTPSDANREVNRFSVSTAV